MQKIIAGILITTALILIFAFGFTLYAQFALDFSLESLREALESSRHETPSEAVNNAYRSNLEGLVVEEVAHKDADFENVVLLEHAVRSIQEAAERSGYGPAGIYLSEVLKGKSRRRNFIFQAVDAVYYFARSFSESIQHFWSYLVKHFQKKPPAPSPAETGVLILGEAERMEKNWKLSEAARYYQEFLDRYPGRPERGFVSISLAHVLTKMRRLDEAEGIVEKVRGEFRGSREETLATALLVRIAAIRKRLARLPELEQWIKNQPERIYREEGGLELALNYIATFQVDRARQVLEKLQEAPDPRIRTKALFYRGLLHKWRGDLARGKEIFQMLENEPGVEEKLAAATEAELAEVHYENKEYDQALIHYEEAAQKAQRSAWKALSELEQGGIYLFRVGDAEAALQRLERLDRTLLTSSPEFKLTTQGFKEALQQAFREQGFRAVADGRLESAVKIFKTHLTKYPRDGIIHSALATIYLLQGSLDRALAEAEKGHSLDHSEYTATVLGYIYEKIGKPDKAEEFYSIGTRINPSYPIAQYNLAAVLLEKGRYAQAEQILVPLNKKAAPLPAVVRAKILNNLGCAVWGLGRIDEAQTQFREALETMPGFSEAQKNLKLIIGEKPQTSTEIPILR